ncbi:hypothetical protein CERSUDRAFT_126784 [Gelatoporia subvermispora B]|uniref:Uncharacterized protein n=1 Tax=Ceriporiopsis subvermispora (strain B) TaxID=914234 RepID=M2R0H6_CERS8|nr:hypothetical protein CERSUDRAFT_126784 [Gelatoporia subvermispora B]
MAPRAAQLDSSDDEAPDTFSFDQQKEAAKGEQTARKQYEAEQKRKLKQKNRERDRVLKERAAQSKGKGKATAAKKGERAAKDGDEEDESAGEASDVPRDDLKARMERAMREAAEESAEGEEGFGGFDSEVESDEEGAGPSKHLEDEVEGEEENGDLEDEDASQLDDDEYFSVEEDNEDDMSEVEGSELEDDEDENIAPHLNPSHGDYLPDHVFSAAFSATPSSSKRKASESQSTQRPTKKRKRTSRPGQDILVGSRTIRTLSTATTAAPAAKRTLVPPAARDRFLKRTLDLKGSAKSTNKGWERRAANIGIMKRNGPAARFVRGS